MRARAHSVMMSMYRCAEGVFLYTKGFLTLRIPANHFHPSDFVAEQAGMAVEQQRRLLPFRRGERLFERGERRGVWRLVRALRTSSSALYVRPFSFTGKRRGRLHPPAWPGGSTGWSRWYRRRVTFRPQVIIRCAGDAAGLLAPASGLAGRRSIRSQSAAVNAMGTPRSWKYGAPPK